MARFKQNTRYTNGETVTNRSNQQFLSLRKSLQLTRSHDDTFITITKELITRPDLISYNAYGTPDLWWVIYEFNGIKDPLFDLSIGHILIIPEINRVTEAIKRL